MTNIILAFCAGAMLIVVLCAVGEFFDELRKLRRLSEWNDKKAVERWRRQKQWFYSADGCSILVELEAKVYGPVPDAYLHAAAAWATKTVLDAAALRENTGKDEAGKPLERGDNPSDETPPARVEGADSLAGDAPAVEGEVCVAEGLDAAALDPAKPHEVVSDSGLLATEDKAVFRVANPSEQ